MILPCVILAGGLGTRMRPLTERIPKAMVPVLGRPFVDWQLELLKAGGIEDVVICSGHLGGLLREHIGDGGRFGLRVTWAEEGERLRGTAGALRAALEAGRLPAEFFLLNGDSYLPIDMRWIEAAWRLHPHGALMTVYRNQGRWDASNVVYRDGMVVLYDKQRRGGEAKGMEWIDYGLHVLTSELVAERVPAGRVADLADLMRDLSREGRLRGLEVETRFYEVGSPAGLADLEAYLAGTAPAG